MPLLCPCEVKCERDAVGSVSLSKKNNHVEWWRGAAIYQIYPRSFADSNCDGLGDIAGITARLDYVAELGVDGIWISPFFTSPMRDFGYDVADYEDVDPTFGSLSDFDALIARAHELDLKVIIDQVYSHSSSEHDWFKASRADRTNSKADWYVWADARADGSPPNNWQSIFMGPAWTWDARRQQYYLHNFLSSQPDLNLHNPEVQDACLKVAKFWLDRGVDGFRLDAINYGMHHPSLSDNPVASPEHWDGRRPVNMQQAQYNSNQEGMTEFLERLRALLDRYEGRFTVAEVGGFDANRVMKSYTQGDARLNTAYSFHFLNLPEFDAEAFGEALQQWSNDPSEGWPSWAFSNHDVPRVASRWGQQLSHRHRCELAALVLISLRGNIFIYQGEELGLTQATIDFEHLQDPEAISNWPHTLGRDGARVPMPWNADQPNNGFSDCSPWLPMPGEYQALSVTNQQHEQSVLSSVRQLMHVRQHCKLLRQGDLSELSTENGVLSFHRTLNEQCVEVCFNFSAETLPLVSGPNSRLLAGVDSAGLMSELPKELSPFSGVIAVL